MTEQISNRAQFSFGWFLWAIGLGAVLASLSMNWVAIGEVGGLTVRPSHFGMVALVGAFLFLRLNRPVAIASLSLPRWMVLSFTAYLAALSVSLIAGRFSTEGVALVLKQVILFSIFSLVAELFLATPRPRGQVMKLVLFSSALGLAVFAISAAFILQREHVLADYPRAVLSGDVRALQWRFYPRLFSTDGAVSTSLRNTLCGSFCVYFFVGMACASRELWPKGKKYLAYLGMITAVSSAFLVVTSVSRSNILVVFAGSVYVLCIRLIRRGVHSRRLAQTFAICGLIGAIVVVSVALWNTEKFGDAVSGYSGRVKSISMDQRIDMFGGSGRAIGKEWLFGKGVATKTRIDRWEQQFHNLFLASWYEAGLLGFATATFFYLTIAFIGFRFTTQSDIPSRLSASHDWLAGLVVLPLVRAQVGGQGGNLSLNDWMAVALLLAFFYIDANPNDPEYESDADGRESEYASQ